MICLPWRLVLHNKHFLNCIFLTTVKFDYKRCYIWYDLIPFLSDTDFTLDNRRGILCPIFGQHTFWYWLWGIIFQAVLSTPRWLTPGRWGSLGAGPSTWTAMSGWGWWWGRRNDWSLMSPRLVQVRQRFYLLIFTIHLSLSLSHAIRVHITFSGIFYCFS